MRLFSPILFLLGGGRGTVISSYAGDMGEGFDDIGTTNLRTKNTKNTKKSKFEKKSKASNDGAGDGKCTVPPLFSPNNNMYDSYAVDACANVDLDVFNIEAAAFRLLTTQSVRVYRNTTFCSSSSPDGVPYKYWNWVTSAISLLDLIEQLQLLPERCNKFHIPLRELLLPGRNESLLPDLDYVIGMQADDPPAETIPYDWWETEFLPITAEAFSCGFNEETDTIANPNILPNDIREYFPESRTIQQVWRLVKGYIRGPQKQRERRQQQESFDVTLYVPFLDVPQAKINSGINPRPSGKRSSVLRTGYPTYQGPAVWFLFHTIAARFYDIEQQCTISDNSNTDLITTVKNFVGYFGLTGPCPYCRYHLMQRVSRNDMDWLSLGDGVNKQRAKVYNVEKKEYEFEFVSESNLYPLEYLFVTGEKKAPTTLNKLLSITDGESMMKYFWKLHNAVSTSVLFGLTCRTDEETAELPWACINNATNLPPNEFLPIEYQQFLGNTGKYEPTTTRDLGRAWPTGNRFAFWLSAGKFGTARSELKSATTKLKMLDDTYGTQIRQLYWTADYTDTYLEGGVAANQVLAAVEELDKAMLKTNLLFTEYVSNKQPDCSKFEKSIKLYKPLNAVLPFTPEGNFPGLPSTCNKDNDERKLVETNNNDEWDEDIYYDEEY